MSIALYPLVPATLAFNEAGTLISPVYGDVYHPQAGALAQAEHVFLRGNGLPERWRGQAAFTVCESGFGQGASFLACWDAWRRDPRRSKRLHFLSFEAHPFNVHDLATLHARLPPSVHDLAAELRQHWPVLTPGLHRMDMAQGQLSLTLVFGPIAHFVHEVQASVDAFFLDGFAPKVNPDMWSRRIFSQFVRIAAPGATAASWCSAGQVRRDLQVAGFQVERAPGFTGKREMIRARLRAHLGRSRAIHAQGQGTAIIGGGFAGAAIAYALRLRGQAVQVFDPEFIHGAQTTHSGHECAALSPLFALDDAPIARLTRAGLLRVRQRWSRLPEFARPDQSGTFVQIPAQEAERTQRALAHLRFPVDWVRWLDKGASQWQGLKCDPGPGLFFSMGMVIRPVPLLQALYDSPLIQVRASKVAEIQAQHDGSYALRDESGQLLTTVQHVVLATAGRLPELLQGMVALDRMPRLKAMRHLAGQISSVDAQQGVSDCPSIVSGNGYVLPSSKGRQIIGSTYHQGQQAQCTLTGHIENQSKARSMFSQAGPLWQEPSTFGGWAGWRASLCDHLPVAGPVPGCPGIWLAGAYGSRGLSWSMLLADYYAARLFGEPSPLERRLENALFPR